MNTSWTTKGSDLKSRCPVCGVSITVEGAQPPVVGLCVNCGQLLWWFRERLSQEFGVPRDAVTPQAELNHDLGADSIDTLDLLMALEEEFQLRIPDEDAGQLVTVADAIRYIEEHSPTDRGSP